MDTMLTCTRCGHIGHDVRTRIVEAPDDATVTVAGFQVPERFRSEPRCIDSSACDERLPLEAVTIGY